MVSLRAHDEPGRVVGGRYRLDALTGVGGMAHIWRATRIADGAIVAFKRMRAHAASDPRARSMFSDEARFTAVHGLPNVVRKLDRGDDDLGPFLVLEWIDGLDLHALMQTRAAPLRPGAALCLARDLLGAVAALHAPGVRLLHRDIAPANVLVGRDGVARLADFGLARALHAARAGATGTALGKLGYLAPEVLRGAVHGTRADLYGVGAVLWESLAGERLWSHLTDRASLAAAWLRAPRRSLRAVQPAVPEHLAALVDRCLALDPAERPSSAKELRADFDLAARRDGVEPDREALGVSVWGALRRRNAAGFSAAS